MLLPLLYFSRWFRECFAEERWRRSNYCVVHSIRGKCAVASYQGRIGQKFELFVGFIWVVHTEQLLGVKEFRDPFLFRCLARFSYHLGTTRNTVVVQL